ncbi:MAG: M20 family metallo-hydrolase [Tissierellia bacterium]|nr:M20 family metallo-hydrolase [Tissierellia bacterium]
MKINRGRIEKDFKKITSISSTKLGCTRLSYSKEDKEVRKYLKEQLLEIGADYREDSVGNIRAKYNPKGLTTKSLLIGSHIDTVPNGGKFDGLTGVVCSLEVLRTIKENDIELGNPIELIIFAEEEGSNFGVTMIGSKYITNKIGIEDLKNLYTDSGETAYDYIHAQGFNIDPEKDFPIQKGKELGMIELHVEQGGVLDKENISVGIVEAIAGMNSVKVSLKGRANHAGTTPMNMRNDALLAASEMIYKMSEIALNYETAVITVGKIHAKPNASNVIAGEVDFYIDIRDVVQENIDVITKNVEQLCYSIAKKDKVEIEIETIGSSKVVKMDRELVDILEDEAKEKKLSYKRMNSGAVHDNAMLNDIIPTAMIFVPSIEGISHSPYEDTNMEDILVGTELLLNACLKVVNNR